MRMELEREYTSSYNWLNIRHIIYYMSQEESGEGGKFFYPVEWGQLVAVEDHKDI